MSTVTIQPRDQARGQALVEFSLAILVFLVLLMGIFDVGRAIYMYNGVSEGAREIARRTSVYNCEAACTVGNGSLGDSSQTTEVIAVQRELIPSMGAMAPGSPDFECVDISGASKATACSSGDFVQVKVTASYTPITLLGITGPITLQSTSSIQIP